MVIQFEIPGKLKGKDRPRHKGNIVYTPAPTKKYEKLVKECFNKAKPKGLGIINPPHAIMLELLLIQEKAKSNKNKYPMLLPDIDNIEKIIMDGLNKTCYKDDKQVIGVVKFKVWGEKSKVIAKVHILD